MTWRESAPQTLFWSVVTIGLYVFARDLHRRDGVLDHAQVGISDGCFFLSAQQQNVAGDEKWHCQQEPKHLGP